MPVLIEVFNTLVSTVPELLPVTLPYHLIIAKTDVVFLESFLQWSPSEDLSEQRASSTGDSSFR